MKLDEACGGGVKPDEDEDGGDAWMPPQNEISVSWGDVQIRVRGDQPLDDIEDRLFRILERLKESLNSSKHHDTSFG